ncbi:hypothetical protein COL20_27120, partial [Bacillus sp. AFS075034]
MNTGKIKKKKCHKKIQTKKAKGAPFAFFVCKTENLHIHQLKKGIKPLLLGGREHQAMHRSGQGLSATCEV